MFNRVLLAKEFRELRWALILGLVLLTGMAILIPLSYQLVQNYRELAMNLLGEQFAREIEFMMSSFDLYIWSQWNPKNLLQVGSLLAIILGSLTIAGEANRGSLDFLASRPASRRSILFNKMLAGGVVLSLVIWTSTLAMIALSLFLLPELENWTWILGATLLSNLGLLVVYAFSVLISTKSSDPVKAGALSGAILLVYSFLGFLPRLNRLSIFWQMKAYAWVQSRGPYPWLTVLVFALLVLTLALISVRIFEDKEI